MNRSPEELRKLDSGQLKGMLVSGMDQLDTAFREMGETLEVLRRQGTPEHELMAMVDEKVRGYQVEGLPMTRKELMKLMRFNPNPPRV